MLHINLSSARAFVSGYHLLLDVLFSVRGAVDRGKYRKMFCSLLFMIKQSKSELSSIKFRGILLII